MTDFGGFPELDASSEPGDFFAIPVAAPLENIQDGPLKCLAVNEAYVPVFAKALERLKFADAWVGADVDVQRVTQQIDHIIGQWLDGDCITCEPEQPIETECVAVGPFHPSIEYWPNHPILSPGYHPDNFSAPVWITGAGFPGVDENDTIINPASIFTPIVLTEHWSVGVPSVRLHFSGVGEATLTFTNAVQGCMAFAFPDGNPLLGDFIDLASVNIDDIIGLGWVTAILEFLTGGFANEVYHKVKFETPGDHTITVWFLPVDDEIPFVGFGGGFRRVEYCGEITIVEESVMVHDLNLDGCNLELRLDGIPIDTVDLEPCIRAIASAGLRDDTCQLQAQDAELNWIDVPGASYMRTQADCPFTDTVEIERAGANENVPPTFLRIDATNTPVIGEGAAITFANKTAGLQSAITSGWRDVAIQTGGLSFWSKLASGFFRSYTIMPNAANLHDFRGLNHTQPVLMLLNAGPNQTTLLQAIVSGSPRFEVNSAGIIRDYVQCPVANADSIGPLIRAVASGVTPAGGFGANISFVGDSSSATPRGMGKLRYIWGNAIDAARSARMDIRVQDYTGEYTAVSAAAYDGAPAVGVLGAAPQERKTHTATGIIQAIDEINQTLAQFGFISDETELTGDTGVTTELVTEIYRDFTVHPCGFSASVASGAEWLEGSGWIDHSTSNFFDIFMNFAAGVEFIEVRVRFLADFTTQQEFTVALDWFQANEAIIIREEIEAGPPVFYSFSAPVFHKNATTAPLRIVVEDLNPGDGSIILQSIDIAVRGLPQLEADEILSPPGALTRAVRYVDLTDRASGYQWMDTHGGTQPPLLLFDAQT